MRKRTAFSTLVACAFSMCFILTAQAAPPEKTQSDNTRQTGTTHVGRGFALGIDGGYTWGSLDTNLQDNTSGATEKRSGADIDINTPSIGADGRYYFGVIPFLQNNIRPPVYCGLWGRYNSDNSHTGLNLDRHPTAGIDTRLTLKENGFVMPYCGLGLFSIQQFIQFSFYLGARFAFTEIIGETDETGGNGRNERFSDTRTSVGPTFGLEGELPIPLSNLSGPKPFFYVGCATDRFPEENITGRSSTFAFNYDYQVESGWNTRGYAGARFRF